MAWQAFSFHFRETYELGYRYLDRCGEFMVRAVDEMEFIAGDVKVTGAKLEMPEKGIKAAVDSNELIVEQELPTGEDFIRACEGLSKLSVELFKPRNVRSRGVAYKAYWAFNSPGSTLKASLALGDKYHLELAKQFGMVPSHKHLDYNFAAGSYEFRFNVQPVTFERVVTAHFNPDFKSSPYQKSRIDRLNKKADRVRPAGISHALMMDLDLMEYEPPEESLRRHYDQLLNARKVAEKLLPSE